MLAAAHVRREWEESPDHGGGAILQRRGATGIALTIAVDHSEVRRIS